MDQGKRLLNVKCVVNARIDKLLALVESGLIYRDFVQLQERLHKPVQCSIEYVDGLSSRRTLLQLVCTIHETPTHFRL